MPKAPLRILIVAALCALGLIGLVVRESHARAGGIEVLLAMEAVDPRALLSGHYVIVALQETLPGRCPPPATETEAMPWLALRPDGPIHRVAGKAPSREAALTLGPAAALGAFHCDDALIDENGAVSRPAIVRLDLGISRFHINQADSERIDAMLRAQNADAEQRVFAIVSIGQDGRARLKGLQVDGERLELNWQ